MRRIHQSRPSQRWSDESSRRRLEPQNHVLNVDDSSNEMMSGKRVATSRHNRELMPMPRGFLTRNFHTNRCSNRKGWIQRTLNIATTQRNFLLSDDLLLIADNVSHNLKVMFIPVAQRHLRFLELPEGTSFNALDSSVKIFSIGKVSCKLIDHAITAAMPADSSAIKCSSEDRPEA